MWQHENGFELYEKLIPNEIIDTARREISKHGNSKYCIRNILIRIPALVPLFIPQLREYVGTEYRCVKAILFQRHPSHNWRVPWHQDLNVQVTKDLKPPGYGPWSLKEGFHNVQPPVHVLENIISTRIHLESCRNDNGPLFVRAKTHRNGIIPFKGIDDLAIHDDATVVEARAGDVLFMKPLLLHASLCNGGEESRKIIHLEWCRTSMLPELEFNESY